MKTTLTLIQDNLLKWNNKLKFKVGDTINKNENYIIFNINILEENYELLNDKSKLFRLPFQRQEEYKVSIYKFETIDKVKKYVGDNYWLYNTIDFSLLDMIVVDGHYDHFIDGNYNNQNFYDNKEIALKQQIKDVEENVIEFTNKESNSYWYNKNNKWYYYITKNNEKTTWIYRYHNAQLHLIHENEDYSTITNILLEQPDYIITKTKKDLIEYEKQKEDQKLKTKNINSILDKFHNKKEKLSDVLLHYLLKRM